MSFFTLTTKRDPFKETETLNSKVNARLAADLETRVKARLDPGYGVPGASEARMTRVAAEGNRLIISREHGPSQDDVGLRSKPTRSVKDHLFRTIDVDAALSMKSMEETAFVDTQMQHQLGLDFPRHLEASIKEMLSERPTFFYEEERL